MEDAVCGLLAEYVFEKGRLQSWEAQVETTEEFFFPSISQVPLPDTKWGWCTFLGIVGF